MLLVFVGGGGEVPGGGESGSGGGREERIIKREARDGRRATRWGDGGWGGHRVGGRRERTGGVGASH